MFSDLENYELFSFGDNINPPNLQFGSVQYNDNINNIKHFLNLDESSLFPENKEPDCSSFIMNSYSISNLEKQNTKLETLKTSNYFSPEHNKEDESNCKLVSFEEIKSKKLEAKNFATGEYENLIGIVVENPKADPADFWAD